jgi:Protein of unknown function (DUF2914)
MPEKKNIVIKVKYPSPGNVPVHTSSQPSVVTVWNFQRIGLVLGGLLLALMALFHFMGSDDQKPSSDNTQLALPTPQPQPEQKAQADMPVKAVEQPKFDSNKAVTRAQLTSDIKKNEPVDKLKLPLKISKKETLWIYYFVELKAMKGKTVFHEWWLNGNLVSRKKVNISDDPWRTASKQLITYTNNNDWIVRVVDESRNKLAEISFNLELK